MLKFLISYRVLFFPPLVFDCSNLTTVWGTYVASLLWRNGYQRYWATQPHTEAHGSFWYSMKSRFHLISPDKLQVVWSGACQIKHNASISRKGLLKRQWIIWLLICSATGELLILLPGYLICAVNFTSWQRISRYHVQLITALGRSVGDTALS